MMKIKYRIYHYDPTRFNDYKYGYLDVITKEEALAHFKISRTATEIYEFTGRKRGEQINPRTEDYLF